MFYEDLAVISESWRLPAEQDLASPTISDFKDEEINIETSYQQVP
jgi:hypothetical protein